MWGEGHAQRLASMGARKRLELSIVSGFFRRGTANRTSVDGRNESAVGVPQHPLPQQRQRMTRALAATSLLTLVVGGVFNVGPLSFQGTAQAATEPDPAPSSQDTPVASEDTTTAAIAAQAAADARDLGGVGSTAPVVGLPPKDQSPPPSLRDAAIENAQRQSQASGKPVVVTAMTTETSLTTAQPDGRFTTQTALGPVRYRIDGRTGADDSGKALWADLDLSLTGQDADLTTAESAGPWAARLAEQSGAGMVQVGPAGQVISWSPAAAAAPMGTGGPGGALPSVSSTVPASGVTPVTGGIDLEVPPATTPDPRSGRGADAPAPVITPSPDTGTPGADVSASQAGSDAVFPGVLKGGRDYTVTVTATGAEESVVLASRDEVVAAGGPRAAAVYRNTFTLPAGVSVRQAAGKNTTDATALGVEFVDAAGAVVATFGGGKAFDSSAKAAGEPATVPVATRLLATTTGAGTAPGSATVEISVDPAWVADAARVFPLTIDPHIATGTGFSGSTGPNGSNNFDAYVDEAYPTTAEGVQDSGRLLAGYRPINGATKGSTTLVYFNLGDLIGSENTIFNAQFSLWNNYSYSCNPTGLWVDAATSSWNPATVTWNTRPGWANAGSMKTFAHGYSSSCAAAAEFYNVTPIVQKWSNSPNSYYGGMNNYGFIITANGGDASGYKRFNSAETGSGMPGLTVTWENCTNYPAGAGASGTRKVCGSIRDAYAANGGPNSFGLPTTSDAATPNGKGYYNHFDKSGQARSIYWSPSSGAHTVVGAIRDKWATDGWENSLEGWPYSDDRATPSGEGAYNHFLNLTDGQTRSIYWTPQFGAHRVGGLIRDRWAALGWETTSGYPTSEEVDAPGSGGKVTYFAPTTNGRDGQAYGNSAIYWKTGNPAAWSVHGRIYQTYQDLGATSSWLGYPISNEYHPTLTPTGTSAPSDAWQTDFENGVIYGDPRTGYTAAPKAGTSTPVQRIDDSVLGSSDLQFDYSGNWSTCDGCGDGQAYQDGFRYSFDTGSSVTFRFVGSQAIVYGTQEPGSGIAQVSVDGGAPTDLDLYSSTDRYNAIFTTPVLTTGTHSIRLSVSGRKNTASWGTGLSIDWAQVGGAAVVSPQPPVIVEDDVTGTANNSFEYVGWWGECTNCTSAGLNYHYSGDSQSRFTFRFSGIRATLWGAYGDGGGIAFVSVDGGAPEDIDQYAVDYEVRPFFTTATMTPGDHTITVGVTGLRNPLATDNGVSIERAEIAVSPDPTVEDLGGPSDLNLDNWISAQVNDSSFAEVMSLGPEPQTLSSSSCITVDAETEYCAEPLQGAALDNANLSLKSEAGQYAPAAVTPASYCDRQTASNQTRRNICLIGTGNISRYTRGAYAGGRQFTFRAHAWLNSRLKADQVLRLSVTIKMTKVEGNPPPASSTMAMSMSCGGACTSGPVSGGLLTMSAGSSTTWNMTATPKIAYGALGFADLNFLPTAYVGSGNIVVPFPRKYLTMRCDDIVGKYAGCVNPKVRATAEFSRAQTPKLAAHIAVAQNNGLPKVLTRDSANSESRRRKVCPDSLLRKTVGGKPYTCDEYPFATTEQGGNLPVRVPPGCVWAVQGYSASRPDSYGSSRCLVPAGEQNLQGSIVGNMVQYERVMEHESYNVRVVS